LVEHSASHLPGAQLDLRFHLRNIAKGPVQLASEHWRQGDRLIVLDENGVEQRTGCSYQSGIPIRIRYVLQPGQEVVLDSGALGYRSFEQVSTKSHFPVIYQILSVPGRYTIRYELEFHGDWILAPDGRTIINLPGADWTGTIFTGAITILFR